MVNKTTDKKHSHNQISVSFEGRIPINKDKGIEITTNEDADELDPFIPLHRTNFTGVPFLLLKIP